MNISKRAETTNRAVNGHITESGRQMSGLRMICKLYGGMKITQNGKTVNYVWDYAGDEPVPDTEMPVGSERWNASERAKHIKTEMH